MESKRKCAVGSRIRFVEHTVSHISSFFDIPFPCSYHGHAEPCDQENIHAANYQVDEGPSGAVVAIAVILCLAVLFGGIYVIRRRRWNKAAIESAKDPDNIAPAANDARGEII